VYPKGKSGGADGGATPQPTFPKAIVVLR